MVMMMRPCEILTNRSSDDDYDDYDDDSDSDSDCIPNADICVQSSMLILCRSSLKERVHQTDKNENNKTVG